MLAQGSKTLIGVLASHDSVAKNKALRDILEEADRSVLAKFGFVFTGGTYDRLFKGNPVVGETGSSSYELSDETKTFLQEECGVIRLPSQMEGGVIVLSCLVTLRRLSILWPFFTPLTTHLLFPENLSMLRLADQWRVKKLMNSGSVKEWLDSEARRDVNLNLQNLNLDVQLRGSGKTLKAADDPEGRYRVIRPGEPEDRRFVAAKEAGDLPSEIGRSIVALISHDAMKSRMEEFVIDHEHELSLFGGILATGTTGGLVQAAAPELEKVHRYHSGPKGGDIEIATEVLFGGCHVVIFFVDPLNPHPHPEDIRVVFGACMLQDRVRMLSNEAQARDWMDRLVRGT